MKSTLANHCLQIDCVCNKSSASFASAEVMSVFLEEEDDDDEGDEGASEGEGNIVSS